MKFDELYNCFVEQNQQVLEEGILSNLRNTLIATALGFTDVNYVLPRVQQIYNDFQKTNPEKIQEIEKKVNTVVQQVKQQPQTVQKVSTALSSDKPIENIKKIIKTSPASNQTPMVNKHDDKNIQVLPKNKKKSQDFLAKAKKYIEKNENHDLKIRNRWYKDNKGYPTIGIGHLITSDDIKKGILKQGEYTLDKNGNIVNVVISDDRAREIFNNTLKQKLEVIKNQFPSFESYPENIKIVLLDGFFRGDLSGSPTAKALLRTAMDYYIKKQYEKSKKYLNAAADEYLDSDEYRTSKKEKSGIYRRMENNADIMRNTFEPEKLSTLLTQNVYL